MKYSSKQRKPTLTQENELISLILKLGQEFINDPVNTKLLNKLNKATSKLNQLNEKI